MSNATFAAADLSDSQVRDLLSRAIGSKSSDRSYIEDVNRVKGMVTYKQWGTAEGSYNNPKLYQASFTIGDDDYKVTIGEAKQVVATTVYEEVAAFSVETGTGGDVYARFSVAASEGRRVEGDHAVYPKSLLFRAGEYADKKFSITPAELTAAAAAWTPISGNVQHTDFLKGRAGSIAKAWTENDGKVLYGEVRVPLALDTMLVDGEKRLSMEWNRAGKFADGFALVTNPRIEDAALMSLQTLDAALKSPQASPADTSRQAVTEKDRNPMSTFIEKVSASVASALKAVFAQENIALPEDGADVVIAKPAANVATVATASGADDAKFADLREKLIETQAELFASAEFAADRITPAERAGLIERYKQAARDDNAAGGTVSFSNEKGETVNGSRVDALKAHQQARTALPLTGELIDGNAVVFGSSSGSAVPAKKAPSASSIFDKRAKAMGQK